jgi:hypothetical protein
VNRILFIVLTVLVVACGGAAAPSAPRASTGGAQPSTGQSTAGAAATPGSAATPANPAGGAPGDVKSIVTALIPPGSTQINATEIGGSYTVQLMSQSSMSDLQAFFDQKIPTLGITQTGKTSGGGTTIYAFTNPDGGITMSPLDEGGILVTIAAGTSS